MCGDRRLCRSCHLGVARQFHLGLPALLAAILRRVGACSTRPRDTRSAHVTTILRAPPLAQRYSCVKCQRGYQQNCDNIMSTVWWGEDSQMGVSRSAISCPEWGVQWMSGALRHHVQSGTLPGVLERTLPGALDHTARPAWSTPCTAYLRITQT